MKIRHLFLAASAAVALSPAAFAATTPAEHCDALQKKFDTEIAARAWLSERGCQGVDSRAI